MRKITVSAVQMDVKFGDLKANLEKAVLMSEKAISKGANIIILPEMWPTGFDYETISKLPRSYVDDIIELFSEIAFKNKAYFISGTMAENSEGRFYNTSFIIDPAGKVAGKFRKIHLFKKINEHEFFAPGWDTEIFNTHIGKLGIAICFDLRFPELFRKMALQGAEIIFVPAEFPSPRLEHWDVLLRARAIENQLFIVGCNRVGKMKNIEYFGHSMIIDPYGNVLNEGSDGEEIITEVIDLDKVEEIRNLLPTLTERRPEVYSESRYGKPIPAAEIPLEIQENNKSPFKFKSTIQPMKPRH